MKNPLSIHKPRTYRTDSESSAPHEYIEAVPLNGDVKHAIRSSAVKEGQGIAWARALCGVRGRDSYGSGGMRPVRVSGEFVQFTATDPNPSGQTDWNGRVINEWCPRCIRKVAAASSDT